MSIAKVILYFLCVHLLSYSVVVVVVVVVVVWDVRCEMF